MNTQKCLLLIFLYTILGFFGLIRKAHASLELKLPILIINQIRGSEVCCEAGSAEIVEVLNSQSNLYELPLAWALRYDALQDETFLSKFSSLPKHQSLGILLEVTPQLASASAVKYKDNPTESDWYSGRNAFLIGYTQDERKKIIDTVFKAFYDKFKYYPTFTVSWMIDGWSLAYIRNNFGVRVHEITKEQYETDSYTLYGGVFNLPYYPTTIHPLIPAPTESEKLDLLIVRQTISDIEKNYGSYKSYFTSQPNDYLTNPQGASFTYFSSLIDKVTTQEESSRFGVLGLENSKEWAIYKDEYLKQLQHISEKQKEGKVRLLSPFDFYNSYRNIYKQNPIRILKSQDFPKSGVLWYFGKKYRALLEIWNGKIVLSDFRIFGKFTDPYLSSQVEVDKGYWIVPYLLDSSQEFSVIEDKSQYRGHPIRSDPGVTRFGIELAQENNFEVKLENEILTLGNTSHKIVLTPDQLEIYQSDPVLTSPIKLSFDGLLDINTDQYFTFPRHPRFFLSPQREKQHIVLGWENKNLEKVTLAEARKKDNWWYISPSANLSQQELDSLAVIFQPDRARFPFDRQASTFYWHNREAIAGRSPVRLFVDPRNVYNRPVALNSFSATISPNSDILVNFPQVATKFDSFFVDFTATKSAQGVVRLNADKNIIPGEFSIRFYNDCKKELRTCFFDRKELLGFTKVIARDKYQEFWTRLKDLITSLKNKK